MIQAYFFEPTVKLKAWFGSMVRVVVCICLSTDCL